MLENNNSYENLCGEFTEQPTGKTTLESGVLPDVRLTVTQPTNRKRKERKQGRLIAALICTCMIGSGIFGFSGSCIANEELGNTRESLALMRRGFSFFLRDLCKMFR